MNKYIDADMLEKDGWNMQRIRQSSPTTMVYETKKPTDFPAADVAPQWIPVTDRLPAYGEDVLLSMNGDYSIGYLVPTYDGGSYEWYHSGWFYDFNEVDAWMPLPEYKGGAEE